MAVGASIALLPGCGNEGNAETVETGLAAPVKIRAVNVALDGWEVPETAGIVMAEHNGHFADLGIEVNTLSPVSPTLAIPDVVAGADEFGVAHGPEVVMARDRGAPIVIVGSLVPQPTAAMIWTRKSGIESIADLKGKTVAIPGLAFQKRFLQALMVRSGLDPGETKIVPTGNDLVPALASGRADAIFGGSWDQEGIELEQRGLEPVVTRVQALGIPSFDELVLIARTDHLSKDPQLARDFLAAVSRGTAEAAEDPKGVVDALEDSVEAYPRTGPRVKGMQADATVPLLSKSGYVSPARVRGLVEWMREEGIVRREMPASDLFTNAYLSRP